MNIDRNDTFMAGHAVRTGGATGSRHAARIRKPPKWTKTDAGIQAVLLHVFPKLLTNERQRQRAAIWARIIYLYYRSGYTYSEIVEEMNLKSASKIHPTWKVESIIRSIHRVTHGRSANGTGTRVQDGAGRPRKIVP